MFTLGAHVEVLGIEGKPTTTSQDAWLKRLNVRHQAGKTWQSTSDVENPRLYGTIPTDRDVFCWNTVMAARYQAYSSEQGHCVVSCDTLRWDVRGLVWQLVRGRGGLYPFGYFATGTAADGLRAFPMGPQRVLNPIHRRGLMGLSLKIQQKLLRPYPYLPIGWRWPFHGSRTLKSDQPSWHVVSCKAPLQRCPALPWVKLQILQDPLSSDSLQAWSQERGQRNQCLDWAVFKADSFKANLDQFGLHPWFVETFWSYSIHHSGSTIPFLIRKYVFNATKQMSNGCLFPYVTLRVTLVFHSCHSKIVTVSPSIPQHPRHLCMWRFCDFIHFHSSVR